MILEKQPLEVFCKKGVLKNVAIFTGKYLCWSLFAGLQVCNFIKKRLQRWCFPVNTANFLRTPILKNICERLLLTLWKRIDTHSWRLNNSSKKNFNHWKSRNLQFCKRHTYKEKSKENACKSDQIPGGKLSRLARTKFNFPM